MSVVAWDGKMLAADKQMNCASLKSKCTKIYKMDEEVLAFTGDMEVGLLLIGWYKEGADPAKYPEVQKDKDRWTRLIVVNKELCFFYEMLPVAIPVEDSFAAWGSGRDFALGAMAMNADARQAVEIANRFSTDCGFGVDWYFV